MGYIAYISFIELVQAFGPEELLNERVLKVSVIQRHDIMIEGLYVDPLVDLQEILVSGLVLRRSVLSQDEVASLPVALLLNNLESVLREAVELQGLVLDPYVFEN